MHSLDRTANNGLIHFYKRSGDFLLPPVYFFSYKFAPTGARVGSEAPAFLILSTELTLIKKFQSKRVSWGLGIIKGSIGSRVKWVETEAGMVMW